MRFALDRKTRVKETAVLCVLLLQSLVLPTAANEVQLERMIVQLRSQVDTDRFEINSKMQEVTGKYLDDYYGAYYKANSKPEGYFLESDLTVTSLGVHGVQGSFITTLEIDGALHFDPKMEAPSDPFVDTLLRNSFQGQNERIYLNHLLGSDSNFLRQLTHIFIEIADVTVAETEIQRTSDGETTTVGTTNSSDTGSASQYVPEIQTQPEEKKNWFVEERWAQITIYVAAGVVGLFLLCGCCCIARCLCCPSSRKVVIDDEDNELGDEPIKVLTLPVKRRDSRNRGSSNTPISQSNTEGSGSGSDSSSLEDQMGRAPPSPERSFASQDSSKFTYSNNNQGRSVNTSRLSIGSLLSKFSMDMQSSIDLDNAQHPTSHRPNTISKGVPVPPFGHDISAIETPRDLSLIEEEDDEELGHHHLARARERSRSRASRFSSTRRSLGTHVFEDRRSRSSSRSSRARSSSNGRTQLPPSSRRFPYSLRQEEPDESQSSIDMDQSSGDVIADLRNLSLQIEQRRKGRRAPDPR